MEGAEGGEREMEGERGCGLVRWRGRQWWVLTLTINVDCHPSFRCHLVIFKCGWLLLYMGGCLGACALVFIHRGSFSYVGSGFHVWVIVSVHGRPFSCVCDCFHV